MSTRRTKIVSEFKCDLCPKKYSKKEHLQRHERTHTGAKPYSCKVCNKAFSRVDALSRHIKVHGPEAIQSVSRYDENVASPTRNASDALLSRSNGMTSNIVSHQTSMQPPYSVDSGDTRLESTFLGPSEEVVLNPMIANDSSYLLWPDSEAFLQSLMSSDLLTWEPPFNQHQANDIGQQYPSAVGPALDAPYHGHRDTLPREPAASGAGQRALEVISGLVLQTPGAYALPKELSELTPRFLDSSLHMFLVNFIPILPLVHRPTFTFNSASPLLLSIFALGSSFLGTDRSLAKSEGLWQLTHAGLVRSWPNLIVGTMEHDGHPVEQLSLAALLHQIYALLSQNQAIRESGSTFGALTLQWAENCEIGKYSKRYIIPSIHQPEETKAYAWRLWVDAEVQLRACLGTFIAAGVATQLTGSSTTFWLKCMSLPLPADDATFNASGPDHWISAASHNAYQERTPLRFSHLCKNLLSHESHGAMDTIQIQLLDLRVVLEILGVMALESGRPFPLTVGLPLNSDVALALLKLRGHIVSDTQLTMKDRSIALLRLHTVCLEMNMCTAKRARRLCNKIGIKAHLFGMTRPEDDESDDNVTTWISSVEGRRSLLHALEISAILTEMPTAATRDIYVVGAILAAATTYASFASGGVWKLRIPPVVDWETALIGSTNTRRATDASFNTTAFIDGQLDEQQGDVDVHNLVYDLIALRILVKGFSLHWSILMEMENLMYEWTKRFG